MTKVFRKEADESGDGKDLSSLKLKEQSPAG